MGIKKMVLKRVMWPAVSMGTAWLAEQAMEKGMRRTRGGKAAAARREKRGWGSALAWTATTAAVAGVAGMAAERGVERALRRMEQGRKKD
jgi:Protein of unknown function (DUF4235)